MIDVIYSTYFFVKTLILLNLITKVSHIKIIQVTFINFPLFITILLYIDL